MHRLRIVPVALVAVALIGASLLAGSNADAAGEPQRGDAARMMRDLMSGTAAVGGPFTLTDVDGRRRSLADFRGKVVILYFGYTFCPDVCPTNLASIAHLMQVLGPDSAKVQPLFVTLDPQRDTAEVLREFVAAFDSRLVALRGSETEVRRVATSYKLYFREVYPQKSSTYFIEHASLTYLLDQEGRYIAFFPPGTTGKRMAVLVRERL